MFLGYQNELIALVANTREELMNAPCITFTKIEETDQPVEIIAGIYYVGAEQIDAARNKLQQHM